MANRIDYTDPDIYDKHLGVLEDLLGKLFKFLKDGTPVSIRNSDYIPSY